MIWAPIKATSSAVVHRPCCFLRPIQSLKLPSSQNSMTRNEIEVSLNQSGLSIGRKSTNWTMNWFPPLSISRFRASSSVSSIWLELIILIHFKATIWPLWLSLPLVTPRPPSNFDSRIPEYRPFFFQRVLKEISIKIKWKLIKQKTVFWNSNNDRAIFKKWKKSEAVFFSLRVRMFEKRGRDFGFSAFLSLQLIFELVCLRLCDIWRGSNRTRKSLESWFSKN